MTGGGGPPRLLVVVAHPDDETFGCGSLLLHAAAAGAVTAVACATRGGAGVAAPGSVPEGVGLGAVREGELRAAARLLGVSRVDLLGLADSGLDGPAGPATLVGAPFDDVRARVQEVVEDFRPSVVVTLDGGDGHRDHVRVRDATLAAAEAAAWRTGRVYLHCLPRSLVRRWLEEVAARDPGSAYQGADVPGTPDEDVTTVLGTAAHLPARERAMAAHASQASPFAGLSEDLRLAFLTADRLRRVVPPWTGGPPERDVLPRPAPAAHQPRSAASTSPRATAAAKAAWSLSVWSA